MKFFSRRKNLRLCWCEFGNDKDSFDRNGILPRPNLHQHNQSFLGRKNFHSSKTTMVRIQEEESPVCVIVPNLHVCIELNASHFTREIELCLKIVLCWCWQSFSQMVTSPESNSVFVAVRMPLIWECVEKYDSFA